MLVRRLAVHSEDTARLGRENGELRAQVAAAQEAATRGVEVYKVCLAAIHLGPHSCCHAMSHSVLQATLSCMP